MSNNFKKKEFEWSYDFKILFQSLKSGIWTTKLSPFYLSWMYFSEYHLRNNLEKIKDKNNFLLVYKNYYPKSMRENEKEEFFKYILKCWDITLNDSLPFKIERDIFGGLQVKSKKTNTASILKELRGYNELITNTEHDYLEEKKYSSLIELRSSNKGRRSNKQIQENAPKVTRVQQAIMFGPLSLVNNDCYSEFVFDEKIVKDKNTGAKTIISRLIHIEDTIPDHLEHLEEGVNITVRYIDVLTDANDILWFDCKCPACLRDENNDVTDE